VQPRATRHCINILEPFRLSAASLRPAQCEVAENPTNEMVRRLIPQPL
jgi:hypothetical protein